jgi:hypothetical protein
MANARAGGVEVWVWNPFSGEDELVGYERRDGSIYHVEGHMVRPPSASVIVLY